MAGILKAERGKTERAAVLPVEERKIGDVRYALHRDWLEEEYVIVRVEVVARCATREEARQWMIDRTEERRARGEIA